MEVTFKNSKIKKICTEPKIASKKYSEPMADIIAQRIVELRASETIEELLKDKIGRCHSLKGDRKGQYAMDLIHPQRLVFTVHKKQIQIAKIIEIVDYH
ncbi:type II toxin-antitoxin system RelE/ParE family toxin [bacterium]|nr:type II toxin-antitoxin system RelE/ParE family toxin [bacterium]